MQSKTDPGLINLLFLVFIVCAVAWWNGWDRAFIAYVNSWVETGTQMKNTVEHSVDNAATLLQEHQDAITKQLGE